MKVQGLEAYAACAHGKNILCTSYSAQEKYGTNLEPETTKCRVASAEWMQPCRWQDWGCARLIMYVFTEATFLCH